MFFCTLQQGGGRIEYLLERGRMAARRLEASGLYSQISAKETTWGGRVGDIMAKSSTELMRIRHFGAKSLLELKSRLGELGIIENDS